MQPLVWLPAVVFLFCPPVERWQCDAATSCHVRIPMLWLVSVHYTTSSVYPQQAIHMLMLATASLIAWWRCTPPSSHWYGCLLSSSTSVHRQSGGNATRQLPAACASQAGGSYLSDLRLLVCIPNRQYTCIAYAGLCFSYSVVAAVGCKLKSPKKKAYTSSSY